MIFTLAAGGICKSCVWRLADLEHIHLRHVAELSRESVIHGPQADSPARFADLATMYRGSPLFLDLGPRKQHALRPPRALIDPGSEKRHVVRPQRGESLPLGLGRHLRIRHVTRHVIDQWALLAVPGDDGRLPGCA